MQRLFAALLLLLATNALAGVSYRFDGTSSRGRVIADGKNIRIEFDRGDNLLFRDSSVAVSTDGGKTLTLLDPATKTFTTLTLDEVLRNATAGLNVRFTNPKVTARLLGDGGTLEGYPTRKSSLDAAYDIVVEVMGQQLATHVSMHTESWRTDRLPEELTSFVQLKSFHTGIDAVDKLIDATSSPQLKGFPLKEVTTMRTKSGDGREATVTSSIEVHDVRRVATTPAQFAVPAGYKRR